LFAVLAWMPLSHAQDFSATIYGNRPRPARHFRGRTRIVVARSDAAGTLLQRIYDP
jgi:hypothetical protein